MKLYYKFINAEHIKRAPWYRGDFYRLTIFFRDNSFASSVTTWTK
jgi:hypothetical protein